MEGLNFNEDINPFCTPFVSLLPVFCKICCKIVPITAVIANANKKWIKTKSRSSRSQMFFKIGVLKNFAPVLESIIDNVAGLKAYNFIKKRLQYMCLPVKFAKFFRTTFLQNTSHSVHWGINPPQKHPPSFLPSPLLKSANCPSPPLFRQVPRLYWFFVTPPLKVKFFSEPSKY